MDDYELSQILRQHLDDPQPQTIDPSVLGYGKVGSFIHRRSYTTTGL